MNASKVKWKLSGMSCASCASKIERFLKKEGLEDIWVDFSSGEVTFTADDMDDDEFDRLSSGLREMGYNILDAEREKKQRFGLKFKLIVSALLTLPLLLGHIGMAAGLHQFHISPFWQFLLSLPVMYIGVIYFGRSAWMAVKQGTTNMDVLIFGGSFIAFVYSTVGLWLGDPSMIFFEASASIITLVLLGNHFERQSLKKAGEEIRKLEEGLPVRARVVENGEETELPVDRLELGMEVVLAEGEAVAADGLVKEGNFLVNESLITGESRPVRKESGEELIGGTVIMEGSGSMTVLRTGGGTYLSRLMQLVRRSQSEKPPIHRFSDRVSRVFIPLVLVLSVVTFAANYLIWDINVSESVLRAVAVLVIACPCAMGLATPAAVMVGAGAAVKRGVVFRNGEAFEALPSVKNVVFDKTGTLTKGEFAVKLNENGSLASQWLPYVLAMERRSAHPIARSINKFISENFPGIEAAKIRKVREIKGVGMIAGDSDNNEYSLGDSPNGGRQKVIQLRKNGKAVFEFSVGDEIKEHARELIKRLKDQDRHSIIISGDRNEITAEVAAALGVVEFYSEKKPEEKLQLVKEIMQNKGRTAVLGDGINDAAAIAAADVGIAFSEKALVSVDSASVVLMRPDLQLLEQAIQISRLTFTTIKQNLYWAFSYNIVAIPMAAVGLLDPIAAAAFMAFSDLVVVANALRLKWKLSKID